MARIKAECPGCGTVRLSAPDVHVLTTTGTVSSRYRFECPVCAHAVVHETTPAICAVLVSVGASEDRLPAELAEAHHGAPFHEQDVVAFRRLLEGDAWMAELLGDPPTPPR